MKLLFFLFGIILIIVACEKDDSPDTQTSKAVLIWTGGPETDGVGLWVEIDNTEYKVSNENDIDTKYKTIDRTVVVISYQRVGNVSYISNFGPAEAEGVKILRVY